MIQWRLLHPFSNKRSLSVLLSHVEMDRTTRNSLSASPLTVVRKYSHTCACVMYRAATAIWGRRLYHSKLLIVRLLFKGGIYIWRNTVTTCYEQPNSRDKSLNIYPGMHTYLFVFNCLDWFPKRHPTIAVLHKNNSMNIFLLAATKGDTLFG